jgi:hypothetical protein
MLSQEIKIVGTQNKPNALKDAIYKLCKLLLQKHSTVRIVIRLQGGRPTNRGWTSDNGKRLLSSNVHTVSCAPPVSYSLDIEGCSPAHGAVGREADYSNTSATDVSGQPIGPIYTGHVLFLLYALWIAPKHRQLTTNKGCATSQKSEILSFTQRPKPAVTRIAPFWGDSSWIA